MGREELLELPPPVAPPVDVEDVDVVEQPIEDRGGQDLVPGKDFRPVQHVFADGHHDAPPLLAC